MAATPLFSILLPTHNRPETLAPAIRSVLMQTVPDWELLVVGDGCTDGTADLVRSFGDPRIRWFDLPKAPGFGYANRNIALRQAAGDLIAFLGHDNLLFVDHLERMAAPFVRDGVHWAYSRPLFVRDDGVLAPMFMNLTQRRHLSDFLNRYNMIPATSVVHRRVAFDVVGFWPEDQEGAGDWTLWKRIIAHYGPGAVRLVRSPTNLHFRANWRNAETWAVGPMIHLFGLHDAGRSWPAQLDLALPAGMLPQAAALAKMQVNPGAFAARIRNGTEMLQDMLAWKALFGPA